jgi:hypothetical protein
VLVIDHADRPTSDADQRERFPLVEFVQVLRRYVQILRRRFELRVTEPHGDGVKRPSGFEFPAAGLRPLARWPGADARCPW